MINKINNIETYLNNAQSQYPSCLNLSMPTNLTTARSDAIAGIIRSQKALPIVTQLRDTFASSTDPQEQLDIIDTYNQMQSNGELTDLAANSLLEVYIDFELKEAITSFKKQIDAKKNQCEP